MFDTTIIRPDHGDHHHTHNTTVIEKRAPTDESAKMLREYEEAANKRWIELVRITDNSLNCVIYQAEDYQNFELKVRAIFNLNGKKITVDLPMGLEVATNEERVRWMETKFLPRCGEVIAY